MKFIGQIFLLFLLCKTYGQDITFKNINTSHGLSSNLVYNACQGPDDLLWIIANYKLDSYNEGKVTNYSNDAIQGIEDFKWAEVMIDSSNLIWLKTLGRELHYLDHNRRLQKVETGNIFSNGVLNFLKSDEGRVDVIAREGHFHYNIEQKKLDTIHLFEKPIYKFPALQISKEENGLYVISASNKAIIYDSKIGENTYVFDDVRSHGAAMVNEFQMLVSTANHHELFLVDIAKDKIIKNLAGEILEKFPQTNTYYRRIKHLDSGYVGITSGYQGLFIMSIHDFSVENYAHDIADPNSISSDNSYFLYTGRNGNVFVTSRTSGLNIFNRSRKNANHIRSFVIEEDNSIFEGHISHLVKDSRGFFWLASAQGLLKYSHDSKIILSHGRKQENDEFLGIVSMHIDQRDRLFLGVSGGGLEILDNQGSLIKSFKKGKDSSRSLKSNYVYSIIKGIDGNVWIGTSGGISILNLNTLDLSPLDIDDPFKILNARIREIKVIGEETFIGTWRKGGFVLSEGKFEKLEIPEEFEAPSVTDFERNSSGRLYVGSENGLFFFQYDSSVEKYRFIKKRLEGRILSVDKDKLNNIWVAVENILYKFHPEGERLEEYTEENGFTGGGFRMHASYIDKEGRLYYGLNTGYCHFDPEELSKNEVKLNPQITGAFQDDEKILISGNDEINLSSDENNIGVYYQNIDIWNNPIVQYQYSISGDDDSWEPAITNPILIQNIQPGSYNIKVKASNDNENWVLASNELNVKIDFPWWRSWWFYILSTLIISASIYYARKLYIKLKADKLEEKKYDESLKFFSFSMHKYADMEKEFWDLILKCIHQLDVDACAIYLVDTGGDVLQRHAINIKSSKDEDYSMRPDIIPLNEGVIGSAVTLGKPIVINDLGQANGQVKFNSSRKSKLCVPIISNNEALGVIDCEHHSKNYFNERRLSFISAISTIVATKIVAYNAEEERKQAEISLSNNLKKVSELEMKSLRSQMNPHFMFNSLNSINNFIVKNDQENASDYLTSFARLMRIILENSRQDWVSLESELSALRLYIGMEKLRFENLFFYHESISEDINLITTLVPPMLIQPYIENAIWHGLLPKKSNQCNLKLIIEKENDTLKITIEDDGIGTKASKRNKSNFNITKKSFGQKIISERLDMINKIYQLEANVQLMDKSDVSETLSGTKVILSMKLKMASV